MKIEEFGVENWMNTYENDANINLAETCVDSLNLEELLALSGIAEKDFVSQLLQIRLSYGDIMGSDELRSGIANFYKNKTLDNVIITHGGAGANFLSIYSLIEAGDEVISVYPTYQQLYSIPESFGAKVKLLKLKEENNFALDINDLNALITPKTKMICLNNPDNPTCALMDEVTLNQVVEAARKVGAWIHCDEAYYFMQHSAKKVPFITDLYEKGISSCSLSKCFSLAGLRLGWLAGNKEYIKNIFSHRDYTTISCGRLDDFIGIIAVKNHEKIFKRNLEIVLQSHKILNDWINNEKNITWINPNAGTTGFLKYNYNITSADFCKKLLTETGVFLTPGIAFGKEFDNYIRIGYAYSPDVLRKGLEIISKFLKTLN